MKLILPDQYSNLYTRQKAADSQSRIKLSRAALRNNPHIATTHFQRRLDCLIDTVIKLKFCIQDYQYRFEFQGRSSIYAYRFVQLYALGLFNIENDNKRNDFTKVQRRYLFVLNPEPRRTAVQTDRSAISLGSEISNTLYNLSDVINRVQRYKCSDYCQRRKRGQNTND